MSEQTHKITRSRRGFTIAETLVAILILSLVGGALAGGVRQYRESMLLSETKVLCSTLTSVIQSELANTKTVELDGTTVKKFFSANYAIEKSLSGFLSVRRGENALGGETLTPLENGYGEVWLGTVEDGAILGKPLLSSRAYTTYRVGVKVTASYNGGIFDVTLRFRPEGAAEDILVSSFDVLPLNDVKEETE